MLSALLLVAVCLQQAPSAPRDDAREPPPPPLQLAQWLVVERPRVVLARAESVHAVGVATHVVRLAVEETLHAPGPAASGTLTVLTHPGHVREGQRALWFLRPYRDGPRWELVQLLSDGEEDFAARISVMRGAVALLALDSGAAREAGAFGLLAESLLSPSAWTRGWAADELEWIAVARPGVLLPGRRAQLRALAARLRDPVLAARVESVAGSAAPERDP